MVTCAELNALEISPLRDNVFMFKSRKQLVDLTKRNLKDINNFKSKIRRMRQVTKEYFDGLPETIARDEFRFEYTVAW